MSIQEGTNLDLRDLLVRQRVRTCSLSLPATVAWFAAAELVTFALVFAENIGAAWSGWRGISLVPFVHLQLLLHGVAGVLVVLAIRQVRGDPWRYLAVTRPTGWDVFRGIGWGLGTLIAAVGITLTVMTPSPLPGAHNWAAGIMDPVDKFAIAGTVAFWTIVAAPVSEEMIYRGLLYRGLVNSGIGTLGAILLSALAFGLAHKVGGWGWDKVVFTTILGLVLGFLRWRNGSLTIPMIAHMAFNFPSSLTEFLRLLNA